MNQPILTPALTALLKGELPALPAAPAPGVPKF